MIECIISIDYEIYGNGTGSLRKLVYEPTERLAEIFEKANKRFVIFVEVSELEMMEKNETDPDINLVKQQIQRLYTNEFEIGLHLHPWWYNAKFKDGSWILDYSEYNLCTLPRDRIIAIIDRSIAYLRYALGVDDFTPVSYRAGHLLFQPTQIPASILADRGVKVDSSVYKGGLWHQHGLDYRPARRNGYYWRFSESINTHDPRGRLLELPVYTHMVPSWRMLTGKRIGLQRKGSSATQTGKKMLSRINDYMRFSHPLKFDICSMTINELKRMVDSVVNDDRLDPTSFKPIVAIGHTKDLVDYDTIKLFLSYLEKNEIKVSKFEDVHHML